MANYEEEKIFRPVIETAVCLLEARGFDKESELIKHAEISVVNTDFDNWNGGLYGYTVYIKIPVKTYASLSKEKIKELEKVISESLNEVTKGDDNHYFGVQISPGLSRSIIDWSLIGGESAKKQMKSELEAIKDIMISVATGGERIQSVDARYKSLHSSLLHKCKLLNIQYDNPFRGLWDWYGRWSNDLPTYHSRRQFISDLLAPSFDAIDNDASSNTTVTSPIVELTDWERINRTILKIKQESSTAKNEEDYQQIGLLCREVIISLAQAVFNPEIHGTTDENGTKIGKTDAMRMIGNYINMRLSGSSNEELRAYARTTNKLANLLTHKRDAHKQDMLLTVAATISLINFIGILEDKV